MWTKNRTKTSPPHDFGRTISANHNRQIITHTTRQSKPRADNNYPTTRVIYSFL